MGQSPLKTFLGVMHSVTDISAPEQKENYTPKNKEWTKQDTTRAVWRL